MILLDIWYDSLYEGSAFSYKQQHRKPRPWIRAPSGIRILDLCVRRYAPTLRSLCDRLFSSSGRSFSSAPCSQTPSIYVLLLTVKFQVSHPHKTKGLQDLLCIVKSFDTYCHFQTTRLEYCAVQEGHPADANKS
jgi:hypothetical protein